MLYSTRGLHLSEPLLLNLSLIGKRHFPQLVDTLLTVGIPEDRNLFANSGICLSVRIHHVNELVPDHKLVGQSLILPRSAVVVGALIHRKEKHRQNEYDYDNKRNYYCFFHRISLLSPIQTEFCGENYSYFLNFERKISARIRPSDPVLLYLTKKSKNPLIILDYCIKADPKTNDKSDDKHRRARNRQPRALKGL